MNRPLLLGCILYSRKHVTEKKQYLHNKGSFTLCDFLDCDCDLFLLIMGYIGVGDVVTVA